jgi:pyruvate,water dikinase
MRIVSLRDAADPSDFGAKACHLGRAIAAGLPVPPGCALSVEALAAVNASAPEILPRLREALAGCGSPVAARSSAIGEDAADSSFAGQHLTVLNLASEADIVEGLREVYRSAHDEGALAYRRKRGITAGIRIAAVVQKLVDPVAAGVLFTRNPMTGARECVIEASWGLGEVVVAGLVTPDHYRVDRTGRVLEARAGDKHMISRCNPGGRTREVETTPQQAEAFCLSDGDVARLCHLAQRCEDVFGPDLDLEWAVADGAVWLLQARPITTRFG